MATELWQAADAPARGRVAPGFEPVAEAFARNFTDLADRGAAFAACHRGQMVVDLWGGEAAPGRPWAEDTLQVIFSGTKALAAACVLRLIERGAVDVDRPVADYWPAFAAGGKDRVLVRHALSHRAGVPGLAAPVTMAELCDDAGMEARVAAEPLFRDPEAFHCYHALTIGWIMGGIVRHVTGRSIGRMFAEEIAAPLGLDAHIGLPEAEEARVGAIVLGPGMAADAPLPADPTARAIWGNPPLFAEPLAWNTRALHEAEIPGAGGIATARAMARFFGCLALGGAIDGVRILAPETVEFGRQERSRFHDPFIPERMAYGLGWAIQTPQMRFGPAPDAFGHSGAGGSIHGAWPSTGTGFSYTMSEMRVDPEDLRSRRILDALYAVVRGLPAG
jgi:CubicO group peptidase (beta-lactamase class C family)